MNHNYFVYILTNYNKTVLYIGVTNDLRYRLCWHQKDAMREGRHFAGKYRVVYHILGTFSMDSTCN